MNGEDEESGDKVEGETVTGSEDEEESNEEGQESMSDCEREMTGVCFLSTGLHSAFASFFRSMTTEKERPETSANDDDDDKDCTRGAEDERSKRNDGSVKEPISFLPSSSSSSSSSSSPSSFAFVVNGCVTAKTQVRIRLLRSSSEKQKGDEVSFCETEHVKDSVMLESSEGKREGVKELLTWTERRRSRDVASGTCVSWTLAFIFLAVCLSCWTWDVGGGVRGDVKE